MYDLAKIHVLIDRASLNQELATESSEHPPKPDQTPSEQHPLTTTQYGHSLIRGRNQSQDIDRAEIEHYLGWYVNREPLTLPDGTVVKTHVANVRSDSHEVLGVVTTGFQTIQNSELIELADTVRNDQQLRFTNAGVTNGGSRVFFQCRGESFDIGDGDEVVPYMLFCNGHDGSLSCRMSPMTERIWCQNQLGNIVRTQRSFVTIRHTGDTRRKLEEARRLGQQYFATIEANRIAMLSLRDTAVKTEDLQRFFHSCFEEHFGAVSFNPKTEDEEKQAAKAKQGYSEFVQRFEKEKVVAGCTVWNMANAYTGWLQHDLGAGKNPQRTAQKRYHRALIGVTAKRCIQAFRRALELAS